MYTTDSCAGSCLNAPLFLFLGAEEFSLRFVFCVLLGAVLGAILGGLLAFGCIVLMANYGDLNRMDGSPAMAVAGYTVMTGVVAGALIGGITGAWRFRRQ